MLVLSPDLASHFNVTLDLDRVVFDTEDREIVRGPYALTVRLGAQSDSPSVGIDVRADWLRPFRNVHLWGAFLNELSEYFGHAYLGGKLKIATGTLISGAYGFGFGDQARISTTGSRTLFAESVDWGRLGVVYVSKDGWKGNVHYRLTDPTGQSISGIEGGFSYPVKDAITIGITGNSDVTDRDNVEKNWRGYVYLTYGLGGQKATPFSVALDKNDPIAYPVVLRQKERTSGGSPLRISPTSPTVNGCSGGMLQITVTDNNGATAVADVTISGAT